MTTKLEQVARAIYERSKPSHHAGWDIFARSDGNRDHAISVARAAIEAMRGPTTGMKRALIIHRGYDPDAKEETLDRLGQLDIATMHVFISAYEAMIDAALEEK